MNRTIKFRGIDEETLEWVYGDLIHYDKWGDDKYTYQIRDRDGNHFNVIDKTVGQFTGLLDKNGREVYEGDIVKHIPRNETYVCEWTAIHACFTFVENIEYGESYYFQKIDEKKIEIIGNIYDNPELLNEK